MANCECHNHRVNPIRSPLNHHKITNFPWVLMGLNQHNELENHQKYRHPTSSNIQEIDKNRRPLEPLEPLFSARARLTSSFSSSERRPKDEMERTRLMTTSTSPSCCLEKSVAGRSSEWKGFGFNMGSLNVPIEHHPTIRYMVYNGYYKVMSNIPKMGQLPTPVQYLRRGESHVGRYTNRQWSSPRTWCIWPTEIGLSSGFFRGKWPNTAGKTTCFKETKWILFNGNFRINSLT